MNVLRLVPVWAWGALLAAIIIAGGWLYINRVTAQRDAFETEMRMARGEVAALESALAWRRSQARQLQDALASREEALAEARRTITEHRDALDTLESRDDEVGDWAGDRLPDAVGDWLRKLRGQDDPGAGDAQRAAPSDRAD